ncbi:MULTISPECIES: tol-pal system YbgF family protein [unclassified Neisseria]|uniref:tetratricopeptide repeat protein n=1 Tax=unclassified Neisseria TaxID=2623750 RepID=UPI002666953C|nr:MULTISPECIES: tetratricopeptide repeat protein [unclassified Neisseria]MDO1509009.1 hypothetical protein [Neisseria sp. MVDL19-042950]MDO1515268.1 hypothetical protein [Neisseria sp. MVDL18-041461]MDO1562628.1 hypothetical protein [Neisseria sp. MVDL20-010259]
MKIKFSALLFSSLLLSACAGIPKQADKPSGIPYPEPDMQTQINTLGMQITRLEEQISGLQTRIRQLERRAPKQAPRQPQSKTPAETTPSQTRSSSPAAIAAYAQAQKHYQNGNYSAVLPLLKNAEGGGNGDETARQSMYLLQQSHLRLGNCESVIHIGNRYVNRFRNSPQAPNALFDVANCQYRMQQQDIARDTWRKLIQIYPDSAAAKRAATKLKKR